MKSILKPVLPTCRILFGTLLCASGLVANGQQTSGEITAGTHRIQCEKAGLGSQHRCAAALHRVPLRHLPTGALKYSFSPIT